MRDAGGSHAVNGGSPGGNGLVAELTDAMEDEEEDGTGGELQRRQSVGSGTRGRHRVVEDLDDNGFCLLSAPTTTYVVCCELSSFLSASLGGDQCCRRQGPSQL